MEGRCGLDGRCGKCSCSCYEECTGLNVEGPCDGDAENDWDSDDVRSPSISASIPRHCLTKNPCVH